MRDAKAAVAVATHMEIYIERWANGQAVHFPWSIWLDGEQLVSSHGHVEYSSPDQARSDALRICDELGRKPDRVTKI